jgi:translin
LAIRALHRRRTEDVSVRLSEAESGIREAQKALKPFPQLAAMGFLHDAEKEYAEARLTQALIGGEPLPVADELQVGLPAWLNGLAEAASELRRHLLDCLRAGDVERGEQLLETMEEVFDMLVTVEYPDAITGGLRRAADALRAVVERSRADVTTTVLQTNLQRAIESRGS